MDHAKALSADDIRPAELTAAQPLVRIDPVDAASVRMRLPEHFACPYIAGTVCECGGRGLCLDVV